MYQLSRARGEQFQDVACRVVRARRLVVFVAGPAAR